LNKTYTGVAVAGITVLAPAAWSAQLPASPSEGQVAVAPRPRQRVVPCRHHVRAVQARRRLAAAGGGAGAGLGGAGGPAPVEVAKAEAMSIVDDVQAVGSLKARRGLMRRPEVSGRIARFEFESFVDPFVILLSVPLSMVRALASKAVPGEFTTPALAEGAAD
jgi:hypothetical protein